jgi:hydrogenase maturation protein HypF
MIVAMAYRANEKSVVLSGGCFQNAYLLTETAHRLQDEHFQVHWPQSIPPNDGGIALGQVMAAAREYGKD